MIKIDITDIDQETLEYCRLSEKRCNDYSVFEFIYDDGWGMPQILAKRVSLSREEAMGKIISHIKTILPFYTP